MPEIQRLGGDCMREKIIEQKFRAAVRAVGGVAVKFVSPGFGWDAGPVGASPGGRMAFVEVKATGRNPARSSRQDTGCCCG